MHLSLLFPGYEVGLGRQLHLFLVTLAGGFLMLSLRKRKKLSHHADSAG